MGDILNNEEVKTWTGVFFALLHRTLRLSADTFLQTAVGENRRWKSNSK